MKRVLQLSFIFSCLLGCYHPFKHRNISCELLVVNPHVVTTINQDNATTRQIDADVFIVNNSDDTLKYPALHGLNTKFYVTDEPYLTPYVEDLYPDGISRAVVPPHESIVARLSFDFPKTRDATLKFRIGMHLLKWSDRYENKLPDRKSIAAADILWSDEVTFDTSKKQKSDTDLIIKQLNQIFPRPSEKDRNNYVLSIEQNKIKTYHDTTTYGNQPCVYFIVPLRLTNKSNDTLKYYSMTCDSTLIFGTSNTGILIRDPPDCDKNADAFLIVPPHRDTVFHLPLYYNISSIKPGMHFKLGMTLFDWHDNRFDYFMEYIKFFKNKSQYYIWSNEAEIPKP
jgi:hypothetical protein